MPGRRHHPPAGRYCAADESRFPRKDPGEALPPLPASNGALRMFVSLPASGSTPHEKRRVRGDTSILVKCKRGARGVTTSQT